MKDFELAKNRLDARKKKTPMDLEEANRVFYDTTISIGKSIEDESYYWFAFMSECHGFDTVEDAVNDALDYLKNDGY